MSSSNLSASVRQRLLNRARETVVAEKFHGIVRFGMANSRMKDYFDLWFLAEHFTFAGEDLKRAMSGTFRRRQTDVPKETPLGLTDEFAGEPRKTRQWDGFVQTIGREVTIPSRSPLATSRRISRFRCRKTGPHSHKK